MTINTVVQRPSVLRQDRIGVPWATVVGLAAVVAFADGFWLTSLRGAVGAIERTQSPFSSWWHESSLSVPIFAFAVLGALILAKRWFGPVLRKPTAILGATLLVVAATTLAGIAELVASSAYDYHLQSVQLRMMNSMGGLCTGNCLAQQQHATLAAHVRGVLYVSRPLLITNLVIVAWLVAMWGGRLKVTRARRESTHSFDAGLNLRLLLAAGLVASAAIHAAVVPEHLAEWAAAGVFFILLTAAEVGVAALLFTRVRQQAVLLAAVALSVGPLLVWLYSRTAGLPFGPEAGTPEAIGLPDIVACTLEAATLLAAVVLIRAAGRVRLPVMSVNARALALVAVVAVMAIGLAGTETPFGVLGGSSGAGMAQTAAGVGR